MYAQMAGAYPCGSRYDLCSAHAVLSVSDGYPVLFLLRVPEVLFGMYFIKYLYGTKQQREKYNWKWGLCSFAGRLYGNDD